MMYSSANGLSLQHNESPCQIRFVQKVARPDRSNMPAIIAGYFGNLGIGIVMPEKELHVNDQCINPDAECANRKGPLLISASWRNVIMSKVQSVYYDMIGGYTNWAQAESRIYIAAHDQSAQPATKQPERVYFGGVVGGAPPVTRFENFAGKFYATKFVQKVEEEDASEIMSDADSFLDMTTAAKSMDLSHVHVAVHAKAREHHHELTRIRAETSDLAAIASRIKAKLTKS